MKNTSIWWLFIIAGLVCQLDIGHRMKRAKCVYYGLKVSLSVETDDLRITERNKTLISEITELLRSPCVLK
jgi:hypothetical protein